MRREKHYYVYIMASRSLTLYTGVTDDLYRRVMEHKEHRIEGFTKRYRIDRLVYYETFKYVANAIRREKQIKAWTRAKRVALIKSMNPTWQDLAEHWYDGSKLQVPRFARDDNSKGSGRAPDDARTREEELQLPRSARDDKSSDDILEEIALWHTKQ